jgi:imidazolonepropionase-like amidohydrolase
VLVLRNAVLVPGDGHTVREGVSVVLDGERIVDVTDRGYTGGPRDDVIDLAGRLLVPGAINPHAHVTAIGPRFASGAPAAGGDQVLANLDRQLRAGTTTVLNLDGFNVPGEIEPIWRRHPVNLRMATIHFDQSVRAARAIDGTGLTSTHEAMTVDRMLSSGAVAIGEVGAGHTLAGDGVDYLYIPRAVERETGVRLEPRQATRLKYAVLGRRAHVEAFDVSAVQLTLTALGLADRLTPEKARELIHTCVLPPFQVALDGIVESARLAVHHGVPTSVHTSAPSEEAVSAAASIAGPLLVSGHTNHATFIEAEAIDVARRLKRQGAWIEVSTLDAFGARRLAGSPSLMYALLRTGLVDFVSTDYAGGHWDDVYLGLAHAVADGVLSLPAAVAMASRNVTRAFPRLAPDRGEIAVGRIADLAVCRDQLDRVDLVFVSGKLVCEGGLVRHREGW